MRRSPSTSALARARHGDWNLTNELLAGVVDALAWLQWAKTKDGAKNRNRPKPIPRPSNDHNRKSKGRMSGAVSLPVDEVRRRLSLPRQAA